MPDLDAGHYFFTALVPVCNDGIVEHAPIGGGAKTMKSSPIHLVRETLETLPTALQSHATEETGIASPFARSLKTHFARFAILDQPNYNGRDPQNAITEAIGKVDLLMPQPQDALACPYLIVVFDFDPATPDAGTEPRAYLEELWNLMPAELTAIFRHCYGFKKDFDAAGFAGFLISCQIETTMSFNDYWTGAPPLGSPSVAALAALPVGGFVAPLLGHWFVHWSTGTTAFLVALALLAIGLAVDAAYVIWKGKQPFPGNPDATLRHILKGLYLQQAFARFAGTYQDQGRPERGAAFRAFLDTHRPDDLDGPTQPPGVIRAAVRVIAP